MNEVERVIWVGRREGEGGFSFTFIGQLISSSSSHNAGTTFGINSCHSLTHRKWWKSELESQHKQSQNMSQGFFFFCSGMIHNAASPKAGKLTHALSTLSAKTHAEAPRCSGCWLVFFFPSFCFSAWKPLETATASCCVCVLLVLCTCVLVGLEVQRAGSHRSWELFGRSLEMRRFQPSH